MNCFMLLSCGEMSDLELKFLYFILISGKPFLSDYILEIEVDLENTLSLLVFIGPSPSHAFICSLQL